MPTWLKALIDALTSKLGGIQGWLARKLLNYGGRLLLDWIDKQKRAAAQKKAEAAVQKDIESGAPRTDETRKHEQDLLNS